MLMLAYLERTQQQGLIMWLSGCAVALAWIEAASGATQR